MKKLYKMKYQLLFFGFLIVASCLQCSDSKKLKEKEKKEEITKTIKNNGWDKRANHSKIF